MKTMYQVYSRLKGTEEWFEDHMPFETKEEAVAYIEKQWQNTHVYLIMEDEYPETASEELDLNDAWDAIGGDWEG